LNLKLDVLLRARPKLGMEEKWEVRRGLFSESLASVSLGRSLREGQILNRDLLCKAVCLDSVGAYLVSFKETFQMMRDPSETPTSEQRKV
jgi:hypothetical protein